MSCSIVVWTMFCSYVLCMQGSVFSCWMKQCLYTDGALVGFCADCVYVRFEIFGSIYVFFYYTRRNVFSKT